MNAKERVSNEQARLYSGSLTQITGDSHISNLAADLLDARKERDELEEDLATMARAFKEMNEQAATARVMIRELRDFMLSIQYDVCDEIRLDELIEKSEKYVK